MKKILIIGFFWVMVANAQSFDAASLGMAGNYSAISRGVASMAWNPANLALKRGNMLEINILSISDKLYNNSFSVSEYNRYFSQEGHHGEWNDADKQAILNLIPEGGLRMNEEVALNLLGVAFNNFGFSVQLVSQGGIITVRDKTPISILLFGDDFTKDYSYHDEALKDSEIYSAIKMSFGYAYPLNLDKYIPFLDNIAVGGNLNYFMGLNVAQNVQSEVGVKRIQNTDDESLQYIVDMENRTANIDFESFPAGQGISIDLGVTARYANDWRFSMSFSNLFGSIRWTQGVETQLLYYADSLKTWDIFSDKTSSSQSEIDTTYGSGAFSTALPITMRLGASYCMLSNLTLTAEYSQGLNERFGNRYRPKFGVGAQYYPLPFVPVRGGISVGGREGFMFALGSGLSFRNFDFDISYAMNNGMWPSQAEGVFTGIGFKIKF